MLPCARRLVNFQPQAVSGSMKKALHTAVDFARFVTLAFEHLFDGFVNVIGPGASPHFLERCLLRAEDRVIQLPNSFAGTTTHDSAGNVAKIAGFLRAWENVQ